MKFSRYPAVWISRHSINYWTHIPGCRITFIMLDAKTSPHVNQILPGILFKNRYGFWHANRNTCSQLWKAPHPRIGEVYGIKVRIMSDSD